jgi:hypothetical protein
MTRPDLTSERLSVVRAGALPCLVDQQPWLIRDIWSSVAVGFIGGQPKCAKTWFALDIAVSVASGTDCLGQFPVFEPGPVLAYLAEDALPQVRKRLEALCAHRRLSLDGLDLHLVDAPVIRLDSDDDRARLSEVVGRLRPRLLILDPLVRLHALDENSSAEISALLGWLRGLSREHHLGIIVVHHMSKRSRANLGQALRGSSDLHAWSDSSAYLTRQAGQLVLTLEHRSAQARPPLPLKLVAGPADAVYLEPVVDGVTVDAGAGDAAPTPLGDRVLHAVRGAATPLSRVALRNLLRINNTKLGDALSVLEREGRLARTEAGWSIPAET